MFCPGFSRNSAYKRGGGGTGKYEYHSFQLSRSDVCRASLYHCFLVPREPFTMETAQNICSKLSHKYKHTINAMLAVNSERCGTPFRTGFTVVVNKTQYQEAPTRIQQAAGAGGGDSLLERSRFHGCYARTAMVFIRSIYD